MSPGSLSAIRTTVVSRTADQEESAKRKARVQIITAQCSKVDALLTYHQCNGRPDIGPSGKVGFEGVTGLAEAAKREDEGGF